MTTLAASAVARATGRTTRLAPCFSRTGRALAKTAAVKGKAKAKARAVAKAKARAVEKAKARARTAVVKAKAAADGNNRLASAGTTRRTAPADLVRIRRLASRAWYAQRTRVRMVRPAD